MDSEETQEMWSEGTRIRILTDNDVMYTGSYIAHDAAVLLYMGEYDGAEVMLPWHGIRIVYRLDPEEG